MAGINTTGSNLSRRAIWIAVAAVVAVIVWYFSSIVFYILISAVFSIICKPVVAYITRLRIRGWSVPRWLAALVTIASIWAIIFFTFYYFIPIFISRFKELSTINIDQVIVMFQQPLDNLHHFLQRYFGFDGSNFSIVNTIMSEVAGVLNINTIDSAVTSVVNFAISTMIAAFSITFITFFMLKEDNLIFNMATAFFPEKHEAHIKHALTSITILLRRYFIGLITESSIIIILDFAILSIIGVGPQTALFIGVVMGILNVIPYLGPVIGASISIIIGILYPIPGVSALSMALIVGCTVIAVNLVDNFILQPVLYAKSVKAHPLEIFIVILMAGSLGGVLGMLLAIPAYNVIRVLLKEFFGGSPFVTRLTRNL